MRRRVLVAVVAVVVAIGALVASARLLADVVAGQGAVTTAPAGIAVEVTVPEGASARRIAALLAEVGVVDAGEFLEAAERVGAAASLRPGRYRLETGMAADDVVDVLLAGPEPAPASSVIVVEGLPVATVLDRLADQTPYDASIYRDALLGGGVTSPYLPDLADVPEGVDDLARWEGLLFPARYDVTAGDGPARILQRMSDEMVRRVEALDWSRLPALGVSRYEALVVASLVEREAKLDEDRPLIASVIYNRLRAGMPLQIDATVLYALGNDRNRILSEDLEIDSPYNTYRIAALPPTPIGTIGEASLRAAADPADTDYLFYVVVSEDGRHGFSTTYEEHQAKVRRAKEEGVLP